MSISIWSKKQVTLQNLQGDKSLVVEKRKFFFFLFFFVFLKSCFDFISRIKKA